MMKKLLLLTIPLAILAACSGEETVPDTTTDDTVESTLCNCLDSTANVNRAECDTLWPEPFNNEQKLARMEEAKACGIELVYALDTVMDLDSLPEPESIDEVLTMDVPDPLSEECQKFLEDFAAAIEKSAKIINKAAENPDDFMLMIDRNDAMDELREWPSKPQMFKCSENESFKFKVEKLTEQCDELLES